MDILYLDLEMTIVDCWFNRNPLVHNTRAIRKYIASMNPQKIGIFSFAVHTEKDRAEVFKMREWLSGLVLGHICPELCLTTGDIKEELKKPLKISFMEYFMEYGDLFDFSPKERAFIDYCSTVYESGSYCLIDDKVEDAVYKKDNLSIRTVNIDKLADACAKCNRS